MSVRIAGTTKMKRIAKKIENLGRLSRLLVAVLISLPLSIFPSTAQHTEAFSGTGLGTTESPYLITDCGELQSIDIDGQIMKQKARLTSWLATLTVQQQVHGMAAKALTQ